MTLPVARGDYWSRVVHSWTRLAWFVNPFIGLLVDLTLLGYIAWTAWANWGLGGVIAAVPLTLLGILVFGGVWERLLQLLGLAIGLLLLPLALLLAVPRGDADGN